MTTVQKLKNEALCDIQEAREMLADMRSQTSAHRVVVEGLRAGFDYQNNSISFDDIRGHESNSQFMPSRKPAKVHDIASAYGVTGAAIYYLSARYKITRDEWLEPEKVFSKLLESGRAGTVRKRLTCAATRDKIRQTLNP